MNRIALVGRQFVKALAAKSNPRISIAKSPKELVAVLRLDAKLVMQKNHVVPVKPRADVSVFGHSCQLYHSLKLKLAPTPTNIRLPKCIRKAGCFGAQNRDLIQQPLIRTSPCCL